MNEIISKRKSIRKYDQAPLDSAVIEKLQAQIDALKPLYPDIRFSVDITNKTRGPFNVKAPHYLLFRSEEKDCAYENIGFIGQQMDLFLQSSGIGSCWLGAAKPDLKETAALPHMISMAFGNPAESLYRELSEFKRKPLSEISKGSDTRLEAARLAPSAVNQQNWYFIAEAGKIHCYRKKSKSLLNALYEKMHSIDMGIAIYHIALESENFSFERETEASELNGFIYVGTAGGTAK